MGDRAADRPTVPRHEVPDEGKRLAHQRVNTLVAHERGLPRRRADRQGPIRCYAVETRVVQIDEQGRPDEPQVERRHKALAARDRLRVLPSLRERRERLVERPRPHVSERCRLHSVPPCATSPSERGAPSPSDTVSLGPLSSSQTRGAVSGSSRSSTPSASATALAIATGADIVAPSPRPFAPSAVNGDGDSRWSTTSAGRSGAVGVT